MVTTTDDPERIVEEHVAALLDLYRDGLYTTEERDAALTEYYYGEAAHLVGWRVEEVFGRREVKIAFVVKAPE